MFPKVFKASFKEFMNKFNPNNYFSNLQPLSYRIWLKWLRRILADVAGAIGGGSGCGCLVGAIGGAIAGTLTEIIAEQE